jgi:hypothetical protein
MGGGNPHGGKSGYASMGKRDEWNIYWKMCVSMKNFKISTASTYLYNASTAASVLTSDWKCSPLCSPSISTSDRVPIRLRIVVSRLCRSMTWRVPMLRKEEEAREMLVGTVEVEEPLR